MSFLLRKLLGHTLRDAAVDDAGGGAATAKDDGRPDDITPEEWADLTEAERRAIAGDDLDDEGDGDDDHTETLRKIAGESDDDGAADAAAAAAATAAATAEADDADAGAEIEVPYRAVLPADYTAQLDTAKGQLKELKEKFRAGEIEIDEYEDKRDAVDAQLRELETMRVKAEMSVEMSRQAATNAWNREVRDFMAEEANALYKGEVAGTAFDSIVKGLISETAIEKHPERAQWSGRKILIEADRIFRSELQIAPAKKQDDQPNPAAAETPEQKARKAVEARRQANDKRLKTLSNLPAADQDATGAGEGEGEFAYLDNLQGIAFENELARMERQDRAKFDRLMRNGG